jgi:hypothetical protein
MTVVYDNKYMTITHHEGLDSLEIVIRMEDEGVFKREMFKFLEVMEECNPDKMLWDMRVFKFVVYPDFERWIDENINAREVEFGIVKEAFVMSADFNIEHGVAEAMDNEYGRQIKTANFLTREPAVNWLTGTGS